MDARILLDEQITDDGDRLVRAMLELTGTAPPDDGSRPPLVLALVLDRSGSMHGEKLAAAKKAAAGLVRRLSPRDLVGVVAYDDSVTTVAEPGTGDAQADLSRTIESIGAGGSTNLSGGWLRGRELVERVGVGARAGEAAGGGEGAGGGRGTSIRRVILLTDGLANVGITDPVQLTGLAARANEAGITTSTIGFGADFDENLLKRMADAGGGATYYIEAADQAGDVFAEELEGLLSIAAQNVRVALAPNPAHVGALVVRHAYPSSNANDVITCELGDLYAREPKRLLAQMMVTLGAGEDEVRVLDLTVTADVVNADGSIERRTVSMPVTLSRSAGPRVDAEVRREALLLDAAEARSQALEAERRGDYDGARATLREVAARVAASAPPGDQELREQVEDLSGMAARLEETGSFDAMDAKYLAQRSYDVMRSKRAMFEKTSRVRREKKPEA